MKADLRARYTIPQRSCTCILGHVLLNDASTHNQPSEKSNDRVDVFEWCKSGTPAATGAVSSTAAAAKAIVIARVVRVMLEEYFNLQDGGNSWI